MGERGRRWRGGSLVGAFGRAGGLMEVEVRVARWTSCGDVRERGEYLRIGLGMAELYLSCLG